MPTVRLCLTLPCRQKQATNAQPQTNPIHSPSKQQTANHMIGIDFAFTHYSPHSVAVMASGQRQRKAILIRGLAVETHKVHKTCCQFIVPLYP
jgi:hypothetical protein